MKIERNSFSPLDMSAVGTTEDGRKVQLRGHFAPWLGFYNRTDGCPVESWEWEHEEEKKIDAIRNIPSQFSLDSGVFNIPVTQG